MVITDLLLVLLGFMAGAVGGVIGVGGGIVFVPALTVAIGLPQTVAQGTSLAAIVPTSLAGAITADRQGNVLRSRIVWMGALGAIGAIAGALLALALPTGVLARVRTDAHRGQRPSLRSVPSASTTLRSWATPAARSVRFSRSTGRPCSLSTAASPAA